jgi:uncharacterized protein YcfJ
MLNDRLVLVGVAAMSAVATAGWMRPTPVNFTPQAMNFTAAGLEAEALTPAPLPVTNTAVRRVSQPVPAQTVQYAQRRPIRSAYDDRRIYDDDRSITQGRSKAKSAAIIGGGAAAGAAIGAMAGGGKGAAIGAVTGGAGGLIYDRMTHKKNDGFGYRSNGATYRDDDRSYNEPRSTGKSAAIIGGSAAAGAAVGGIAGGGKGAAIGALSGGAAGLIYDRITKNK